MLPLYLRDPLFSCYVENPLVRQNTFRTMAADFSPLPTFDASRHLLPRPIWQGHQSAIDCYWKAWELAFGHLRQPIAGSGLVAPYIDMAFNGHVFLWDSVFSLMFGRYGARAFNFQRTLDDLYCKQHLDGFICREIDSADGQDCFHRHDPSSTGPNVFAWGEWEHYRNFADRDRLARVFPVLLAYHQWMRDHRTWQDGSYWSCGWASGMDNQPRVPEGYSPAHSPAHQSWVDACLQAILSARVLLRMGKELGMDEQQENAAMAAARAQAGRDTANSPRPSAAALRPLTQLRAEVAHLERFVNERMWDQERGFYYDLRRDGTRSQRMTIGAFWALLAEVVPAGRLRRFVGPLDDPEKFNRPHRVPSIPADDPAYCPHGNYWCGSVWPVAEYMVLRGLTQTGCDELAHAIGLNHVENVTRVFEKTQTLWENYAPETATQGNPALPDFVGFSGIGPIAVLLEYVMGLRPDAPQHRLLWDVRLLDEHGVDDYPFGKEGRLNVLCAARNTLSEKPQVKVQSTVPLEVELRWQGGSETFNVGTATT